MNNKFVSAVCFIRKYGYRDNQSGSCVIDSRTFDEQVSLYNSYKIPATYLLQYDALTDYYYSTRVKAEVKNNNAEAGAWIELVKPLADDAGVVWNGRDNLLWDHYAKADFTIGYTYDNKVKMLDEYMRKFKSVFGFYPKTIGSWLLDSEIMQYLSEKYTPDAFILCREQWGMDGYTLWGGPYYGLYYPCKNNMQCPAQTKENQINTPVFRMFVNDPIYCYYEYAKEKYNGIACGLFTQEPAWKCGKNPDWVKWHYDGIFDNLNIGMEYTQLGQESCFNWDGVKDGLEMQLDFVSSNKQKYDFEYVNFCQQGKAFKAQNDATPPTGRIALKDWNNLGNKSVWYNSKNYRINIFADKEEVWIRDIHLFCESYRDKYLDTPCNEKFAIYDNLPITDGIRFSDDTTKAGIYFGKGTVTNVSCDKNKYIVKIALSNKRLNVILDEQNITIEADSEFELNFTFKNNLDYIKSMQQNKINYCFDGFEYSLIMQKGIIKNNKLLSQNKKIIIALGV